MASQSSARIRRARPVDPALPRRIWRGGAIGAGNLAAWVSRRAGRGSGASIRGQVITRLYPMMFTELVADRRIAAVSGTNGKTTTTHLLAAAAEAAWGSRDVVTNADGANLREGIASALSQNIKAPVAILEADEQIVPDMIAKGRPEVLVMLNFSRDQLDRHHEIASLGKKWRTALTAAGQDAPTVVANIHDPLVTWSAQAARRVVWVDMGIGGWTADAALCPSCGAILEYDADGSWNCPGCELGQQPADYAAHDDEVTGPGGVRWRLDLQVPGRFNRGNAACALAAAVEMGIEPQTALGAMGAVRAPAGRFSIGVFGGNRARLLLAKNPAGWAESLLVMDSEPVVLAIDSAIADGTDVSWLWDVEFERLAGKHVICTGPRAQDLAVRLSYAEVDHEVIASVREAMARPYEGTVDVLATYTAFLNLCKMGGVEW
ncbi:MurT ligase domain-containing protein [uncultured Propionibacterium sp.]|uniref:MurT ligase domain-containing protein n=1 Tax=uncultured Propionibacterium sp. TaxID=218066 RepID=UPI00292FE9BC|nr:MurT ligase domain-containing protein [uncultured Propionibacterium sp.]